MTTPSADEDTGAALPAIQDPGGGMTSSLETDGVLRPLDRHATVVVLVASLAAGVLIFSHVVWGPCYGDPGEVQLTAAIGAVGHPPGQAGVISIMRFLCWVSPFQPHVTVSGATGFFAWSVVTFLMLLMLRTGVEALSAVIASFLFLADDQFWHAATTPETYATCFMLLVGSIWLFLAWLNRGGAWQFWLAVALFLFLVANRAPTLTLSVPFIVTLMCHPRARSYWMRHPVTHALGVVGLGLLSLAFVWGSLWIRDVPGVGYNYFDQFYPSLLQFPPGNETAGDKLERLWWLVSARQYDYMFHPTWDTARGQANWLLMEMGLQYWPVMLAAALLIVLGMKSLWSHHRTIAVFVLLMIPCSAAAILPIRVISHTTMLPVMNFAWMWLLGLGLTRIMLLSRRVVWRATVVSGVVVSVWMMADASFLRTESENDASAYIANVDWESFPPGATLLADDVIPLIYARDILGRRPDLNLLIEHGRLNRSFIQTSAVPVFTNLGLPSGLNAQRVGDGLFRRVQLLD